MLLDGGIEQLPFPVQLMGYNEEDMDIVCQFSLPYRLSFVKQFKFFGDILSGIVCLIGIQ